ncbi:MAG TPA: tRNA pseudouridine(55) synthase TruB [Acidimicrobiia bacterium]|nr:tRNA pseudouridine(55) synthase TruB [Acidimicrobiia bacterium]
MIEGFLIVDKSGGMTSHDVVARVRRVTGVKKVGHAGTLDPMATGVVVVAIGRVTRLIRFVQDLPKEYLGVGRFGVATDSLDADGAILEQEPMDIGPDDIEAVIPRFIGTIEQLPPMVSALKIGGERLYEIARRGETVERQARLVDVHELEMTDFAPGPHPEVSFRVVCGKGTYVRSLVDDIARALGGRAHLIALRRLRVGSLGLDRAISVDDLDAWEDYLLSAAEALSDLRQITVDQAVAEGVAHGARFGTGPVADIPEDTPVAVLNEAGRLIAVYRRTGHQARPEVVLA